MLSKFYYGSVFIVIKKVLLVLGQRTDAHRDD